MRNSSTPDRYTANKIEVQQRHNLVQNSVSMWVIIVTDGIFNGLENLFFEI
jgi:hypothetical protein